MGSKWAEMEESHKQAPVGDKRVNKGESTKALKKATPLWCGI